jgi:hypothetical protein
MNIKSKVLSKLLAIVAGVVLVIAPSFTGTVVAKADEPITVTSSATGNVAFIGDGSAGGDGELCVTKDALWTFSDGALTIDLDAIAKAYPGVNSLFITSGSAGGCRSSLTSLEIVQNNQKIKNLQIDYNVFKNSKFTPGTNVLQSVTFPDGLESLVIGDEAFKQTGTNASTLASVKFPKGLRSLQIGEQAFAQKPDNSETDNCALTSIDFPEGLEKLEIADSAFGQVCANNTLESVTFPNGLKVLSIGDDAFQQVADSGSNALQAVAFPAGLQTLTIGGNAFAQNAEEDNALQAVAFPAGLQSLAIDYSAFYQTAYTGNNALENFIFGMDNTDDATAIYLGPDITTLVTFDGENPVTTSPSWSWLGEAGDTSSWTNIDGESATYPLTEAETVPLYRLYNRVSGEHLYTSDAEEAKNLPVEAPDWVSEGDAWVSPAFGEPVYRLYNPILGDHHYSKDQNEINTLVAEHGWKVEIQAWFSFGSQPLYRLYNPLAAVGSHHFTRDAHEAQTLDSDTDWQYEGISWYGLM